MWLATGDDMLFCYLIALSSSFIFNNSNSDFQILNTYSKQSPYILKNMWVIFLNWVIVIFVPFAKTQVWA